MRVSAVFAGALFLGVTMASAQNIEVIKARQSIYKSMGKATKGIGEMIKGAAPYDPKAVTAALDTYIDASRKLPGLFPEDSKTGNNTHALPEIWTHKDDLNARFAKLGHDAEAAKASIKDEASFRAEFPKVADNCGGCHKQYRAKL